MNYNNNHAHHEDLTALRAVSLSFVMMRRAAAFASAPAYYPMCYLGVDEMFWCNSQRKTLSLVFVPDDDDDDEFRQQAEREGWRAKACVCMCSILWL